MKKKYFFSSGLFLITFLLLSVGKIFAHAPARYHFIENKGQWTENIIFKAVVPGGSLFIENAGLTYVFFDQGKLKEMHHRKKQTEFDDRLKLHCLKVNFIDCKNSTPKGSLQDEEFYNFYLGSDQSK